MQKRRASVNESAATINARKIGADLLVLHVSEHQVRLVGPCNFHAIEEPLIAQPIAHGDHAETCVAGEGRGLALRLLQNERQGVRRPFQVPTQQHIPLFAVQAIHGDVILGAGRRVERDLAGVITPTVIIAGHLR